MSQVGSKTTVSTAAVASDDDTVIVPARLWEHLRGLYDADVRRRLEHTRRRVADGGEFLDVAEILHDR